MTGPFLTDEYRRWYDQEPQITEIMRLIREIGEPSVREFAADLLQAGAENTRRQIHAANEKGVTSIGLPGIEALYQYKSRQDRWYDRQAHIQRAVGTLYTLPREGLTAFAYSLGDSVGLVSVYGKVCEELGQHASMKDLTDISRVAMNEGSVQGMRILRSIIGPDLFDSFYPDAVLAEPDDSQPGGIPSHFYLESRLD